MLIKTKYLIHIYGVPLKLIDWQIHILHRFSSKWFNASDVCQNSCDVIVVRDSSSLVLWLWKVTYKT